MKEGSLLDIFKHKYIVEEAKMLIQLIAVDCNHFARYKCKITHSLDSQTLSKYISMIVLGNEKHSIIEVLEVLTGVGNFTNTNK